MGIEMLLRAAMAAMGVEIDPAEVKSAVETAKVLIPKIAERFQEINTRLIRIEELLQLAEDRKMPPSYAGQPADPNQLTLLPETGA